MSRRPQREQTVQRKALKWLARRYQMTAKAKRVLGLEEAKITPKERWWGRADGLVVFEHKGGKVHTVAIEAKSLKLSEDVREQEGCGALFLATLVGFVIGAGAAGWYVTSRFGGWWGLPAGILSGLLGAFMGMIIVARSSRFITHAVIDQVERYPGAERWIALPQDMMSGDLRQTFCFECRVRGLGLLVVPRRGEPVVEVEPKIVEIEDPLAYYARATDIRERLRSSKPGIHVKLRGRDWEPLLETDT